MKNSHGFTFIEMLVVLSAVIVLTLSSVFLLSQQENSLQKQLFFMQLETDLLFAQQFAISHQEKVTVHIVPETHSYYIKSGNYSNTELLKRTYSEKVSIQEGSMKLYFHYMPDGNIDSFGVTTVVIGKRVYKLMILIGKGRFYVTEQ